MLVLKALGKTGRELHPKSLKWRRNCISSSTKSVQLDVRLMPSGSTVTLVSFIAISIYIRLFKLKANKRYTLDLPSLLVGLQASCNKKGSLFRSVSSLLYTYKSNSFTGSYKESTSRPSQLLRKMLELVTI